MSAHLVTGYQGVEHITSDDVGSFNAALMGNGEFVLDRGSKLAFEIVTNNRIRIKDGDILMQGRHIRLKETEEINLDSGTQGKKRHDLIVVRYEKQPGTGIESATLEVVKGAILDSGEDPDLITGDISDGALVNQMPLYRVVIDGIDLSDVQTIFNTVETLEKVKENIVNETKSDINTFINYTENNVTQFMQSKSSVIDNKLSEVDNMIEKHNKQPITISTSNWVSTSAHGDYKYYKDVIVENLTSNDYVDITVNIDDLEVANEAGICPTVEEMDGKVRIYAESVPSEDILVTIKVVM